MYFHLKTLIFHYFGNLYGSGTNPYFNRSPLLSLRESILEMLGRLNPKKIIIVSSAPQIRYPDCYGIDMAKLGDLIAFKAAITLLKKTESGKRKIEKVYKACQKATILPKEKQKNEVREIYNSFSATSISKEISKSLKPKKLNSKLEIIYQTIEDLHLSCPNHTGDWYFTGKYPTHGGNAFVNRAFIYYVEGNNKRAY